MKPIVLSEKTRHYLARLGIDPTTERLFCNRDLLIRLQYEHVTRIPYENIDILRGKPLPLDYDGQFDKMVNHARGGYCFELNGLFGHLLADLGYSVTTYMSRYLRGETQIPMRRHRVIQAVCADGAFLCDVGVGQPAPRQPLVFQSDLVQEQFGETYKLIREPFYGWTVMDLHQGSWRRFYSFTEEEQLDLDFVMPSYYCENAPDSIFRAGPMIAIKTSDGRKTIDGNTFRQFSPEGVVEKTLTGPAEMTDVLEKHFGIRLDDEPDQSPWSWLDSKRFFLKDNGG